MTTYEDSFNALFGKTTGGRFMKFQEEGEAFLLVQTGEPQQVPQRNAKTKAVTWLVAAVKPPEGKKAAYKPMDEGTFDENDVHNAFKPDPEIEINVKVVGKRLKNGEADEDFEPFDTIWELKAGNMAEKFKEAMMETRAPAVPGTKYILQLLSKQEKPYKYSIRMQAGVIE